MTKKDYELIGETIKDMRSLGDDQLYVADFFASRLAAENPKFDRIRFLELCGIETRQASYISGGKTVFYED